MKAIVWTKYGSPDVLKFREVEKPIPKAKEILIKVKATTATLGDCEVRRMDLPIPFMIPLRFYFGLRKPRGYTLGQEFSGIVEELGTETARFSIGDEVFGSPGIMMGAYSEYFTMPEKGVISRKPQNVSFVEAACVPLGGLEAWHYIKQAQIQKGNKVLIIGAGGSIGTMGIQLAKYLGAEVTGVDASEQFGAMQEAGADYCIDYRVEDYFNGREKYHAVLDVVGKSSLKKGLELLENGGIYLHANPKILHMLFRRFIQTSNKKIITKVTDESQKDMDFLQQLLEDEKIKPVIDRVMTLAEIVQAHEYVEKGFKKGNLVISIDHSTK